MFIIPSSFYVFSWKIWMRFTAWNGAIYCCYVQCICCWNKKNFERNQCVGVSSSCSRSSFLDVLLYLNCRHDTFLLTISIPCVYGIYLGWGYVGKWCHTQFPLAYHCAMSSADLNFLCQRLIYKFIYACLKIIRSLQAVQLYLFRLEYIR